MNSFSLTRQELGKFTRLVGLIAVFIFIHVVTTQSQVGGTNRSRPRPAASVSPIARSSADRGSQKFDDATEAILKAIQDLNEKEKEEHGSVEAMKKSIAAMKQKEKEDHDSAEERKKKETRILYVLLEPTVLFLGLVVFFTVKRIPGEHNTSIRELFRFRKFRANQEKMRLDRVASDWLFQKNALPYLLRIVGEHFIVFMIVVAGLFLLFSRTLLDVAILSCIEIFFAFVGAYYASLADRSSSMAYEKASLAMRSVMNFSDDLGGFVERLKLLVTRLTGEGKDITMKFVTVIPAFGKVGLSLPEGESYYSRMESQPRPVGETYKTWHDFLERVLEDSGKNGYGRVKVKMLTHGEEERKKWIKNIMIASRLAENDDSPAITTENDFQKGRLEKLQTFELFECQEWKTPPKSNDSTGTNAASTGNKANDNSMPFQFVVINMGIEPDEASIPGKQTVNLGWPIRRVGAVLAWMGILFGVAKALRADNGAANRKSARREKSLRPSQKRYDGSKLMFLFSGDYVYNNFLVDIENYLNTTKESQTERIDLSMHEFVKFSKGYYSESGELIEFFDKLFDFLWTYSKTQKMAS